MGVLTPWNSLIKALFTALLDPNTGNFLTINVSSSLVNGEAFEQEIL